MNLIYIFADQWRRDAIGFYNPDIKTPNMDAFANESAVFDRAYSSCPLCSPARACLLTGKEPIDTGVYTNCKPEADAYLKEDDICISDVLKRENFRTGYIGKWHLDKPDGSMGWDAYTPPGAKRHGFDFWYSYGTSGAHNSPHYWNTEGERIEVKQWSTEHETDIALDFIEKQKDGQFALFISYNPPHTPYNLAPEKYMKMYEGVHRDIIAVTEAPDGRGDLLETQDIDRDMVQGYYAAITAIDDNIGRIIEYLKANNLYDDTYIVISADHGDMLGDHARFGKHVWYEGAVGIPLIIGGGDVKPLRSDTFVSIPDQTATLLGLLGIKAPESMHGVDFSPMAKGVCSIWQESVMTAAFPNTSLLAEEFRQQGKNFMDYGWRSVVTKDYKLAVDKGHVPGCEMKTYLYDLKNDPGENECIYDENVMEYMMGQLKKWLEKTNDGFFSDIK